MADSVVQAFLAVGGLFVLAAAGTSAKFWGARTGAITDPKWRVPVFVLGVLMLVFGGIGAFAGPYRPDPGPPIAFSGGSAATTLGAAATTSPSASPAEAATPTAGPGSVARQGRLTVRAYVAVNLDSTAANWGAVKGSWDDVRDLEWDGPGKDTFAVTGGWANVAVLAAGAPSDFVACSTAQTGTDPEAGGGFHVGERLCVQTGRHLVLLSVAAVNAGVNGAPATLVLDATVWNE